MTTKNNISRYGFLIIAMHWLMVLVFIGIYASVNMVDVFADEDPRHSLFKVIHFSLGLLALALVVVRIVFRLLGSTPPIEPTPPAWQEKLAKLGHWSLYGLMVAMPLLGWLVVSAFGKPVPFFGLVVPSLVAPDEALGKQLIEIHETLGTIGYFLIGGHALAALYHHYFMKDNTLLRMRLK